MSSEFRKLKSLKDLYEINDEGVLRNVETQKIVKGTVEKTGYIRVRIENKKIGRVIRTSIHQLVAEAFIPNPDNKPQVNHIDLNKQNNNVSNLEWVTPSENMKHAYRHGLGVKELRDYREEHKKAVTNALDRFSSISEAAEWLYENKKCKNKISGIAGISAVINGRSRTFGGYQWEEI